MTQPYKCFVITPFGDKNSKSEHDRHVAEHVELVYEKIFRRVEVECEIRGVLIRIADGRQHLQSKEIAKKIAAELDEAPAIIALLIFGNLNVYLELGWAFGMWRNPILLAHNEVAVASDISNYERSIYTSEMLADATGQSAEPLVQELASRVIAAVNAPTRTHPTHLPPWIVAQGLLSVYSRFSKGVPQTEWASTILNAEREIFVCVPRGDDIRERKFEVEINGQPKTSLRLPELLLVRALQGVRVTVIMNDWDNYAEGHLTAGSDARMLEQIRSGIEAAFTTTWGTSRMVYLREVRENPRPGLDLEGYRVILLKNRYMPYRVTLTDKRALVTLRFFTEDFNSLLCIDSPPQTAKLDEWDRPFYAQMRAELEFLVGENVAWTEKRFVEKFPDYRRYAT